MSHIKKSLKARLIYLCELRGSHTTDFILRFEVCNMSNYCQIEFIQGSVIQSKIDHSLVPGRGGLAAVMSHEYFYGQGAGSLEDSKYRECGSR